MTSGMVISSPIQVVTRIIVLGHCSFPVRVMRLYFVSITVLCEWRRV